jgi:hypothetical protein
VQYDKRFCGRSESASRSAIGRSPCKNNALKGVEFMALVFTALALIPFGAHLLELANKLALDRADYLTVQTIYRGWSVLGAVLLAALVFNLALAVLARSDRRAALLAVLATFLLALSLVIFFVWTWLVNQLTHNWLVVPANWQSLRTRWEYSHALNAVLTLCAFCATAASVSFHDRTR